MTAQEHADKAREFLSESDREFERGEIFQGSEKLWGAAAHAVRAVAPPNGKDRQTHRALKLAVRELAGKHNDPSLVSNFAVAEMFHANFYHGFMEDFQMDEDRPLVHQFVRRVLALDKAL